MPGNEKKKVEIAKPGTAVRGKTPDRLTVPKPGAPGSPAGAVKKNGEVGPDGKKKRRRRKGEEEGFFQAPEPPRPKITIVKEDNRKKTLWRHLMWLVVMIVFNLLGGLIFSAIEGNHERGDLIIEYERDLEKWTKREQYQEQLYDRIQSIDADPKFALDTEEANNQRVKLVKDAMAWYEQKLGLVIEKPVMKENKWTLRGGVYYAASLYTTIGYGNYYPETTAGRIITMIYAIIGIPLIWTILLEWGFLYFTWLEYFYAVMNERFCQKVRRVGSDLSMHSMNQDKPLVPRGRDKDPNYVNTTDHQIESNNPLREPDEKDEEQADTVPMMAAIMFFVLWCNFAAGVVLLWEDDWTYFNAFYFFFTSLSTIGLGDVVTKSSDYIIFQLWLTLIGLSVVGLCMAIIQSKVRLVFDRLIRSIESQYRIRQIDPDVATMTLIPDEEEGVKRLMEAQPLQDRLVFLFMDEHKRSMLTDRWKVKSGMTNRITQTYPSKADKYVQTGQRVYDQPLPSDEEYDSEYDEEEDAVEGVEQPPRRRAVPSKRYIYTVFD